MAPSPRFFVPISIASLTAEIKILHRLQDPCSLQSSIVLMTLSTLEYSTTVTMLDLTENSETNLPVPLAVSTSGFSPLPLPFASRIVILQSQRSSMLHLLPQLSHY